MNEWQELCRSLSRKYHSEAELEGRFEDCLHFILKWPYTSVKRQKAIQFGHERKIADLFLLDDNKNPLVAIEMKKQEHSITEHEIGQLHSYMRQELIQFGLLVGDKISLYYDEQIRGNSLKRVLNLSFKDIHNEDGIMLGKLFNKVSFNINELARFCQEYLNKREEAEKKSGSKVTIDNLANFQKNDISKDKKIRELIKLYAKWLTKDYSSNNREHQYIQNMPKHRKWITEEILNADLTKLSDENFILKIRELANRIPNLTRYHIMWNKNDSKVLEIKDDFIKAIKHLNSIPKKDCYNALDYFTNNNEFMVSHLKRAFWSEMIRVKFPEVPLLNNKTERFFDAIGVYIGDTYEEKLKNIANFYNRFVSPNMTLDMLSHLEHFALAKDKSSHNEEGLKFMQANFPDCEDE